jgi:urease accessory protein
MHTFWLDALHVLDSAFPTGAYVHSFGLESFSQRRLSARELESALALRLEETLARLELVFLRHAYARDLVALDERLHAMLLVREPREASALIGQNLLKSVTGLVEDVRLAGFAREGKHHHHPIVFGAVAAALDIPCDIALEAYAFGSIRGSVSAAQRLGWLGQRDAQQVLHTLKPRVREAAMHAQRTELEDAGAFAPAWDIASMVHERAPARMFAS